MASGVDPVTAIANAIGDIFGFANTVTQRKTKQEYYDFTEDQQEYQENLQKKSKFNQNLQSLLSERKNYSWFLLFLIVLAVIGIVIYKKKKK
ncbi:MAG: hypothetical protein PHT77_09835 [Bacteroidales bacterium]|nr:hypothetical protein [Bacteroidales bacterium]MDD3962149.1 hypothetical protein [Bacteroidales bacterium]MDY0286822.1 hypothetical protein [Bacteroidales bacterium]